MPSSFAPSSLKENCTPKLKSLFFCRLVFTEFDGEGQRSIFEQEHGQTDGRKWPKPPGDDDPAGIASWCQVSSIWGCGRALNWTGHNTFTTAGRFWKDCGWSWTFWIADRTLHDCEVAPLRRNSSHVPFFHRLFNCLLSLMKPDKVLGETFGYQKHYRLVCWDCMKNDDPARIPKELWLSSSSNFDVGSLPSDSTEKSIKTELMILEYSFHLTPLSTAGFDGLPLRVKFKNSNLRISFFAPLLLSSWVAYFC